MPPCVDHQTIVADIGGQTDMIYSAIRNGKLAFAETGYVTLPPGERPAHHRAPISCGVTSMLE